MGIRKTLSRLKHKTVSSFRQKPEREKQHHPMNVAPPLSEAANEKFIMDHLVDRWLEFTDTDGIPQGHKTKVRAAAEGLGLQTLRYKNATLFFDGDRCLGGMVGVSTGSNGMTARAICGSKQLTKIVLSKVQLPVPAGGVFKTNQREKCLAFIKSQPEKSFVLKPDDGSKGTGITTGVTSANFDFAWDKAAAAAGNKTIIAEEEIPGIDIRVFVIDGNAHAAAARIPPFIVGDGVSTLAQLRERLVEARSRHACLSQDEIQIDEQNLIRNNVNDSSILPARKVQFLNGTANLSRGGIAVDVTDTLPREVLIAAEKAAAQIPSLTVGGVDIMLPDISSPNGMAITEINTGASLEIHDIPTFGEPRGVAQAIVDSIVKNAKT